MRSRAGEPKKAPEGRAASTRRTKRAVSLKVYEYDTACYRVVWEEPSGRRRYSNSCSTLNEAIERTARHDWPHAIVRETSSREVVE